MADTFDRLKTALADRYVIAREIGAGGMATVYLAEDVKLHRKVALKVLRPDLAAALGPDRFLQEIDIAAKLNHPHILGLFDCGEADGFLYYVMPFIEGESLREKLANEGELPVGDAVRILKEVVDALAEAHASGVVHRDIKPDNVMLRGRHALVTDFGVAKAVSEATGRQQLTTAGVALGTPAYMAPEQAAADPHIDHRADIYAVGAVAYELLTGRPPFTGTTQQELLAAHVTHTPDPVTKYRDSLPAALADLVMKCLEKRPADRWQTAEELIPHLEALATPSGGVTPTGMVPVAAVRSRTRWVVAAVGVVAVIAAGIHAVTVFSGDERSVDAERIAVAPLVNRTGDPEFDTYGRWAATTIAQGLQQVDVGEVVPSSFIDQSLESVRGASGDLVTQLVELTGAGIVVSGAMFRSGDSIELNVEIVDAAEQEVLYTIEPVTGAVADSREALTALAQRVAAALTSHFNVGFYGPSLFTPPANVDAFREYAAGRDMFFRSQRAALPYLSRAGELDTSYAAPVILAAAVYLNAREYAMADSLYSLLRSPHHLLSQYEQLQLKYYEAQVRGDAEGTYRAAAAAFEVAPLSWAYTALLAAYRTNRLEEALEYAARQDLTLPSIRDWRGAWSNPAAAYHLLADYQAELRLAHEIREQHPDWRVSTDIEVRALIALGSIEEMEDRLETLANSRDPGNLGSSYHTAGLELSAHGFADAALQMFDRAIEWYRSLPAEDFPAQRENLCNALIAAERWEEAHAEIDTLLATSPENLEYLGILGVIAAGESDSVRARGISDQLADTDEPYLFGRNTLWRARIAARLGERDEAVRLLRRAFAEREWFGIWVHQDLSFAPLREYRPFQELVSPKK